MSVSKFAQDRISRAYRAMAAAGYRPAAPSDGLGNITVPLEQMNLDAECISYAERWKTEEDTDHFYTGCTDGTSLVAAVWALEALRLMNAGRFWSADSVTGRNLVPTLLRKAADEYERAHRETDAPLN